MPDGLRVLVCGGRDYNDRHRVNDVLSRLDIDVMCHGGAAGADALAGLWAVEHHVACHVYPAEWEVYGKQAGYIRNREMLDVFRPDLVVAFPGDGPGKGTKMMMDLAEKAGVTVMEVAR